MVTKCNPIASHRQLHVTQCAGNISYPHPRVSPVPKSQAMRRTFDILKAKTKLDESGKSYADLAKPLGYERQAVGHWFRGRGEPSVQQMKIMAKELGCHWLELVTEETIVIYREDERRRVEAMRELGPDGLAELDAFLAFKAATKGKT